jgi:uncharacterized cupredoxin-like copper-binding protein
MNRHLALVLEFAAACAMAGTFATPVLADGSVVNVTLWDKGAATTMAMDEGMGMTNASKAGSTTGIMLDNNSANAGEVTFKVTNSSEDTVHEMLVLAVPRDGKLPYDEKEAKFDEDKAGSLGEVEELDPSKSGELMLHFKPGKYVLSCNVANHFANGMWTTLTVE